MAAKTYYFKDAVPSGATLHRSLQDGGTAPNAATTSTGWIAGMNAAGQSCIQNGGSKVDRTNGQWGSSLQPSAAPSDVIGDCWRSENPINGKFSNADWTLTFRILSAASAYTGRFKLGVRIWRSADPTGVGATEITSGRITSAATTADLSTSMVLSLPVTFSPGAETILANEYLFISVGLEITSAGSGNLQDMLFRVSSSALIVTSDFMQAISGSAAASESGVDTISASGKVIVSGSLSATESGIDAVQSVGRVIVGGSAQINEDGLDSVSSVGKVIISGSISAIEAGQDVASAQVTIANVAIPPGYLVIALYRFTPVIELSRQMPTILMTKSNPTIRLKAA